jgi:hypothetical protein
MASKIKKFSTFIQGEDGKIVKATSEKITEADLGKTRKYKILTDVISDGVSKEVATEIELKIGTDTEPINQPPIISIQSNFNFVKQSPPQSETITATSITDPDGTITSIEWTQTTGNLQYTVSDDKKSLNILVDQLGEFKFLIKATDDKNATSEKTINLKITAEPIPEPKPKIKVGQIGDLHGDHTGLKLLKTREQCDLILVTGDVTDTESDDDGYIDAVNSVGLKYGEDLLNAQGNHSSAEENGEGAQEDLESAFPILKETQWLQFLVKDNVCVIVNNTQIEGYSQKDSIAAGHIQKSLAKLKELREAGTVDWCIFMQHKPMYSLKGGHDPEYNFRYNFHKDLDDAGVNFFINGHIHNEQRTVPILFGGEGTNIPPITNTKMIGDAHDMTTIPHGLICIVNGSSTKSHDLSETSNAWTPFGKDDGDAYTIFEFNGKNCLVKFVDIESGDIHHEFKVTKGTEEPEPEKPIIRVTAPTTIKPNETGTINASQSTADNLTMISREALPLTSAGKWINTFVSPQQDNVDLQFTIDATKGEYTAKEFVNVHVANEIPVETDSFGMKMLFKPKAGDSKVAVGWGSDHRNGQRFGSNHKKNNYIVQGYWKLGKGQDKINIKGDGPNHSGCDFKTDAICLWYEVDVNLSDGKFELQIEWPHADNYNVDDSKCKYVGSVGQLKEGNWIGWAIAYYWDKDNNRNIMAFCDPNPFPNNDATQKPLNNWKMGLHAIETGQIVTDITHPRNLDNVRNHDRGFEAEIRMNNATNHDTDMANAWIMEIEPPTN